ncbi:hypothetical protein GQR58_007534 [Nymphon striatum]|nr:hypothetical protein GQR58_007534 [Nymphon striatum]
MLIYSGLFLLGAPAESVAIILLSMCYSYIQAVELYFDNKDIIFPEAPNGQNELKTVKSKSINHQSKFKLVSKAFRKNTIPIFCIQTSANTDLPKKIISRRNKKRRCAVFLMFQDDHNGTHLTSSPGFVIKCLFFFKISRFILKRCIPDKECKHVILVRHTTSDAKAQMLWYGYVYEIRWMEYIKKAVNRRDYQLEKGWLKIFQSAKKLVFNYLFVLHLNLKKRKREKTQNYIVCFITSPPGILSIKLLFFTKYSNVRKLSSAVKSFFLIMSHEQN